jgi:ketosteroid isomerase-like protein
MNRKRLLSKLGVASVMGVAACTGAQPSQPSTPYPAQREERNMNDEVMTVEEVIRAFDTAWSRNDVEGVVALFAEDATLESPLVPHLLDRKDGVCRGRDDIRKLVRALVERGTPWGSHDRPIIQGNRLALEFRSPVSKGDELYSVDVIEMRGGKIQSLRAYLGWRPLMALTSG